MCGARSATDSASHVPNTDARAPAARAPAVSWVPRRSSSRVRSRRSRSTSSNRATMSPTSSRRSTSPLTGTALCALAADQPAALVGRELAPVVHQEAAGAGELVALLRQHADGQLLAGQVCTGELECLREIGLVDVDAARLRLCAAGLQLLEAVLSQVVSLRTAGLVVVGGHGQGPSLVVSGACTTHERAVLCPPVL